MQRYNKFLIYANFGGGFVKKNEFEQEETRDKRTKREIKGRKKECEIKGRKKEREQEEKEREIKGRKKEREQEEKENASRKKYAPRCLPYASIQSHLRA